MKEGSSVAEWRSVERGVPDNEKVVLIACKDAFEDVWLGYWDDEDETWRFIDGSVATVTHWAERPEGPKV